MKSHSAPDEPVEATETLVIAERLRLLYEVTSSCPTVSPLPNLRCFPYQLNQNGRSSDSLKIPGVSLDPCAVPQTESLINVLK